MTVSAAAVACALAVFPQSGVGASLSLLQVRAQTAEVIRTGSCAESSGGTSYFLGNANIELGITPRGDFGTNCAKPAGWYSSRSGIGMTSAYDGLTSGNPLIDYFLPGSPEERFAIGYKTGSASGSLYGGSNSLKQGKNDIAIESMTLGTDTVSFVGKLHSKLQIDCTYTLKPGDKHFLTEVVMKNIAAEKLYDVRYHRSFDPDNTVDAGGSYTTNNKIVSTRVSGDALTVVAATSPAGDAFASAVGKRSTIFFSTADDRAVAYIGGFSNEYTKSYTTAAAFATPQAKGYTHTGDEAIQITFGLSDIDAGASTEFKYSTVLQYVDSEDDIAAVAEATPVDTSPPISASGDPHMINANGDGFDIYRTGVWEFLRMPRSAESSNADLKLEANVTNMGDEIDKCTKALYISRFSLSGHWLESHEIDARVLNGRLHVSMNHVLLKPSSKPKFLGSTPHGYARLDMPTADMFTVKIGSSMFAIGVDHKVVHHFLNMQATGVGGLGCEMGGLLGADDHSWISMRPAACSDKYTASQLKAVATLGSKVVFS